MTAPTRDPAHERAYRTLDGLRGVAALIVVTRHVGGVIPSDLCPESFLAVDLFFLLSGFVIAYAYEARLRIRGPGVWFLRVRLTRLYPLYVLGLVLGAVARLAPGWRGGAPADWPWLLQAGAVGLLLLPAVPPLPMGSSALNGPTWTLLPELIANLVYAAAVRRLTNLVLCVIVGSAGLALVACERVYGSLDGGWSVQTFPLIGVRLAFSFFLGVLMFRLKPSRRTGSWAAWGCLLALAAALVLRPPQGLRSAYELVTVMAVFPAIVAVAVRREPGRRSGGVFALLGLTSYAAYVLHQPLGALVAQALPRGVAHPLPAPLGLLVFLPLVAGVAALADRLYDQPARRWLASLARARTQATFRATSTAFSPPKAKELETSAS